MTMPQIQRLPPHVVNKIAAGEVIERPASVVKELVENSLDAGATRIDVSVEKGGLDLLRVVDNGCGLAPDQLPLAVAPHATSKIRTADDLFRVATLGFRGEALASIAAVSQFTLRSRPQGEAAGAELTLEGGGSPLSVAAASAVPLGVRASGDLFGEAEILRCAQNDSGARDDDGLADSVVPCGCPEGTTVEVRNLFFNTPVRRKFLKSTQTEIGHISEAVARLALAHPNVHFTLRHNGREVYDLPPTADWRERIGRFFGQELADGLIAIERCEASPGGGGTNSTSAATGCRLFGYVANPGHSRPNNRSQYFFLNGRYIRDRSLQHALTEAYRGLLLTGRYPIAFICFEVPADAVDVNVHPTKLEVRFQDGGRLYSLLLGTLRTKFLGTDLTAHWKPPGVPTQTDESEPASAHDPRRADEVRQELVAWAKGQLTAWEIDDAAPNAPASGGRQPPDNAAEPPVAEAPHHPAETSGAPLLDPSPDPAGPQRTSLRLHKLNSDLSAAFGIGQGGTGAEAIDEVLPGEPRDDVWRNFEHGGAPSAGLRPPLAGHSPPLAGYAPLLADNAPPLAGVDAPLPAVAAAERGSAARPTALQVHDRYLIAETGEGVLVIDQHALHERVLYEQLRAKVLAGAVECQSLLVPEPVDLSPAEAAAVLEQRELLAQLGVRVEPFGGDTVLVTSYPAMLAKVNLLEMLRGVVERLLSGGKAPDRRDLLDELLHLMSCKAAVKAGDRLTPEEIDALLQQRHLAQDTHHCPHGRPTALVLTREELDRQFLRT
jgi:DNA mismatch repair protein MutL